MRYEHISKGVFLERPNRFLAYAELAGKKETIHVKNTGRCAELLKPDLCTGKSEYKTEDEVGSDLRGKGRPACQYGLPDTESGRQRMAWRGTFVSGYPKDPSGDNLRKFPV